jgi:co-chaperonin GroES (HSP10)
MEIKMKNNNVLVKELIEEQLSISGLILPKEKHNRKAIVIRSASDEVQPGDVIIKTIGNGTSFKIDNEDYEILHEEHILAIIT